ncbi:MAG TPA: peptidylprolyl isomerase [Gammaproteobacteria bacterium]
MQISDNTVVRIHYTLKNKSGEILDTSDGQEPLAYLHGVGNIIPGLEAALTGRKAGDTVQASIEPKDAYGERHEELVQAIPRGAFPIQDIEPGMRFSAGSDQGNQIVTVVKVDDEIVTVDGNHPLAGETLYFDVEVVDLREATEEEANHGHVHGPGGHHHG